MFRRSEASNLNSSFIIHHSSLIIHLKTQIIDLHQHLYYYIIGDDMKILVLNGPNLNMTGIRKKDVYGAQTLDDINAELREYGEGKGADMYFYQSNHEGDIIDIIHKSMDKYDGVVINAGAYTHYSYAIRDAIECVGDYTKFVEVHMSDIHAREDFRKKSVITDVCVKQISGYGKDSYKMGIDLLLKIL